MMEGSPRRLGCPRPSLGHRLRPNVASAELLIEVNPRTKGQDLRDADRSSNGEPEGLAPGRMRSLLGFKPLKQNIFVRPPPTEEMARLGP